MEKKKVFACLVFILTLEMWRDMMDIVSGCLGAWWVVDELDIWSSSCCTVCRNANCKWVLNTDYTTRLEKAKSENIQHRGLKISASLCGLKDHFFVNMFVMKVLRSFSAHRVLKVDAKFNLPGSTISMSYPFCLFVYCCLGHIPLGLRSQPFLSILSLLDSIFTSMHSMSILLID